jgi:surfeit locus 1 family protein
VALRIGSRIFAPRLFTTLLTLALGVLLVSLGRWQLHRAVEKKALFDAFGAGGGMLRAVDLDTPPLPRFAHLQAAGRYDGAHQILIDNLANADGRAGYFVITPFALAGGGSILVNRGWVPLGASRAQPPPVPVRGDARVLHGRADRLPSPGIRMGHPAPLGPPFPVVANFPSLADLRHLLGDPALSGAAELVLLDPREPDGFERRWQAPGIAPLRHVAYAVQWFALAAALAVIYLVTNTRRTNARQAAS